MTLVAPRNLKPLVHPNEGGPHALTPSVRGDVGRFAKLPESQHDQLVKKTQTWVSQTFFGTLLKQMRNSPFKSELFSGGQGGEKFAALQDQHMAEHMARGAGRKLVDGIVRRIEANAAYRKQQAGGTQKPQPVQAAAPAANRTDPRRWQGLVPGNKPKTVSSHGQATRRT
jgi:Rod binding domain-containing protein